MIISLTDEVNGKMVDKLLSTFSALDEGERLEIYMISLGGLSAYGEIIIDLINLNKDRISLTISGEIQSAAFDIFFRTTCPRKILPGTTGMAHFTYTEISIREGGSPKDVWDKFSLSNMTFTKNKSLEVFKEIGLNEKELRKIGKGLDVHFTTKRMQELLDGQQSRHTK